MEKRNYRNLTVVGMDLAEFLEVGSPTITNYVSKGHLGPVSLEGHSYNFTPAQIFRLIVSINIQALGASSAVVRQVGDEVSQKWINMERKQVILPATIDGETVELIGAENFRNVSVAVTVKQDYDGRVSPARCTWHSLNGKETMGVEGKMFFLRLDRVWEITMEIFAEFGREPVAQK